MKNILMRLVNWIILRLNRIPVKCDGCHESRRVYSLFNVSHPKAKQEWICKYCMDYRAGFNRRK